MTTTGHDLSQIRAAFPSWVVFRSDAGAFYATRLGERLTFRQIAVGLVQTVCADDLPGLADALRDQESRR
jgi:hypothetical protein